MAENFYIGWTRERLHERLNDISEMLANAPITKAQTGPGQITEFAATKGFNEDQYRNVRYAIANHPQFDLRHPIDASCLEFRRGKRMKIYTVYP